MWWVWNMRRMTRKRRGRDMKLRSRQRLVDMKKQHLVNILGQFFLVVRYLISNKLKLCRLGSSCINTIMAYYLCLLGASLNLVPKYIPTLPEMPEPIDLLSPALTLAYSLLNMLVL